MYFDTGVMSMNNTSALWFFIAIFEEIDGAPAQLSDAQRAARRHLQGER